jgi:hypothetical protein
MPFYLFSSALFPYYVGVLPVEAKSPSVTCPYGYYVNIYGLCSPVTSNNFYSTPTLPRYNTYYSTPTLPRYKTYYSTPTLPRYKTYYSTPKPKTYSSYGPSAICRDGSFSYSQSRRGTCSWHGGVSTWLK